MSCGLGAVILMFLLIKKNADVEIKDVNQQVSNKEIELLTKDEQSLKNENINLRNMKLKLTKQEQDLKKIFEDYNSIQVAQREKAKIFDSKIDELETKIKKIDLNNKDTLSLDGKGQQDYLIGLEIKGKKILILLDASASMTDEKLIDIIKRKNLSEKEIVKGPKWQRTLRVIKWLLVRLPESSKVAIIKFSNNSKILGNKIWHNNSSKELALLYSEIKKIVPKNSTNLYSAFEMIREMNSMPDEIFIITDGLPTQGGKNFSNKGLLSKCSSIVGKAKKISGDCREQLFLTSVKEASSIIASFKINVILLPLEGDPQASNNFWKLTAQNNGLLLVPSKDWP